LIQQQRNLLQQLFLPHVGDVQYLVGYRDAHFSLLFGSLTLTLFDSNAYA
jgi:hypothetical protein